MSLLEDVFLQDEANEAEELERVIEGDEFEDRRRSDSDEDSEKDDEAEEDKRKVDPTKAKATKIVKNPRFLLNPARLTGPRGIQIIPDHFKDFKFRGKGHEKEDLDVILKRLEHWAYRLYPKFQFEDCLKKIETLGKKRPVAVHLHKIRSDQYLTEDTVVQKDSSDEDTLMPVQEEDEFDKLLQQQIELARSTPAPNSVKKPVYDGSVSPKDKRTTSLMVPKATSSPSINDEQRERMLRSRELAQQRRLARLENAKNTNDNPGSQSVSTNAVSNIVNTKTNLEQFHETDNNNVVVKNHKTEMEVANKHNRSNVIDSSDEETVVDKTVSIVVDVHSINRNNIENNFNTEHNKHVEKDTNVEHNSNIEDITDIEKETVEIEQNISNTNSENNEINENTGEDSAVKSISILSKTEIVQDCTALASNEKFTENDNISNSYKTVDTNQQYSASNKNVVENIDSNSVQPIDVLENMGQNLTASANFTGDVKMDIIPKRVNEDVMDVEFSEEL